MRSLSWRFMKNNLPKIFAALLAWSICWTPQAIANTQTSQRLNFAVFRGGEPMGRHEVQIIDEGSRQVVEIDINLQVKLLSIPVFRYTHQNREVWAEGQLLELISSTDDDGDPMSLSLKREGDKLHGLGDQLAGPIPVTLPSTSYWRRPPLGKSQLIDSQNGKLLQVETVSLGEQEILANGKNIRAERLRVTGDLNLDLWYDQTGRWVKCQFEARGSTVEYVLQ